MLSCRACRTLYTAHLPNSDSAEDYDSYYCAENLSVPSFINRRLDEVVAEFAPYRKAGRLLDVGFGAGAVLESAGRAGWQAFGVEVSRRAVEHARTSGFEVFCGTLHEAKYPAAYFDVVTATEVLEHVLDPRSVLHEITRVLRPGGLLWATTPHCRGFSARLLGLRWSVVSPPEHLQVFTIGGVRRMLAHAGLGVVRVATEGVNPYELLAQIYGVPPMGAGEHANARVQSSYRLNEALMATSSRRLMKSALNGVLDRSRMGDSLKIWARR